MPQIINDVAKLRLLPRMDVELRGQLVERKGGTVLTGYRMVRMHDNAPPTLPWEMTPYVSLDVPAHIDASAILGETVHGFGVWTCGEVEVTSLTADDSWTLATARPPKNYRRDLRPVSPQVRTIEAPLFSSGKLLRRVRLLDPFGERVIACATDVAAVESALRPVYGDALEILESRWSASDIRTLDDVLNDLPDDKVLKIEYRMDGHGVITRKLRVDYVDDDLVHALGRFPNEILVVEAVVEPAGSPQPIEPWMPERTGPPREVQPVGAAPTLHSHT